MPAPRSVEKKSGKKGNLLFTKTATTGRLGLTILGMVLAIVLDDVGTNFPLVAQSLRSTSSNVVFIADDATEKQQATQWYHCLKELIQNWPSVDKSDWIAHAAVEYQVAREGRAQNTQNLVELRHLLLQKLGKSLPTIHVRWNDDRKITEPELELCPGLRQPVLAIFENPTQKPLTIQPYFLLPGTELRQTGTTVVVAGNSRFPMLFELTIPSEMKELSVVEFGFQSESSPEESLSIRVPVQLVAPAILRLETLDSEGEVTPSRVTVRCSDGVCRYGGKLGSNIHFTDKPVVYPPIDTWQKTAFFYSEGQVEMKVPPGPTQVSVERGFEHQRNRISIDLQPGQICQQSIVNKRLVDMSDQGWVSGDTHIHWVTNAWNVDQPLSQLHLVQRAEDLRIANNLTLLQRYADQAFVKPSQAPMGVLSEFSGTEFHIQMGEEYRNENLYGHLCFLNIEWLVQPIGTGSIIAGPDALDYPINRTAIESCREQGGISIEAHGLGGSKDVPANVVYGLSDALDQMEPEMYYRLLDCGFQLPLSNGSDYPARTVGAARVYVRTDGPFTYQRWIEGIRRGRTFTTSGPLLFLTVDNAGIGDVIHTGADSIVQVKAHVISRDRIGRFQLVSNGKILAEKQVDGNQAEIELKLPVEESRWIVARCSSRTDGRADFGFGDFNAITGPGVAHTSPIYIQVQGKPRFKTEAAHFWAEQLRRHAIEIETKGRFANQQQRQEAVGYIQGAIAMFEGLEQRMLQARSRFETLEELKGRLALLLGQMGHGQASSNSIAAIGPCETYAALQSTLENVTLLSASVNPESRVKISTMKEQLELATGKPERFLIEVENTAGVTAPLRIQAVDMASNPPQSADWCEVRVVDSPWTSMFCTGAEREFKVLEILVREPGLREVRLVADVGQGTQDLGFRATADLLIDARSGRVTTEKNE